MISEGRNYVLRGDDVLLAINVDCKITCYCSFIIFDDLNRYQVNLEKWETTSPEKRHKSNSD